MKSSLFKYAAITWVMMVMMVTAGVLMRRGSGVLGLFNLAAASQLVGFGLPREQSERPSRSQIFGVAAGTILLAALLYLEMAYEQSLPRQTGCAGQSIVPGGLHDWANENIVWLYGGLAIFFTLIRTFRFLLHQPTPPASPPP
jgi:hypothetical protein